MVRGMDIGPSEAEPSGTAFLLELARRGRRGVKLMISDAHEVLWTAINRAVGRPCRRGGSSACIRPASSRASLPSAAWNGAAGTACRCANSWPSPVDPNGRIAGMKDRAKRLAYEPEHAVDLATGAVVAATVQRAGRGDTATAAGEGTVLTAPLVSVRG